MKAITFPSHGYELAGHLFEPSSPKPRAFLLIHGWMGRQNLNEARALASCGFTSLTYDMRGHGQSTGNFSDFSRADFVSDAVTAYDYLKNQVAPGTAIGAVGGSFGAYTAVLLSSRRPLACLSLRVPANYPDEGFDQPQEAQRYNSQDFATWRQQVHSFTDNSALQALHNFRGPVQIVEAGKDELVPHQVCLNYVAAVADKHKLEYDVMKGAPHSLASEQLVKEYGQLLTGWAARTE